MVCVVSGESISVHFAEREGSFLPERNLVHIELRGMSTRPSNVLVHSEEVSWSYEEADGKLIVSMAKDAAEVVVEVRA
jgi:hypothetical protein